MVDLAPTVGAPASSSRSATESSPREIVNPRKTMATEETPKVATRWLMTPEAKQGHLGTAKHGGFAHRASA